MRQKTEILPVILILLFFVPATMLGGSASRTVSVKMEEPETETRWASLCSFLTPDG